jgi:arsenite methyltransferase
VVACLGSCSTAGQGQVFGWIDELSSRPQNVRFSFRNLGVGGDLAFSALQRQPQCRATSPNKVVILLGANVVQQPPVVPEEKMMAEILELVDLEALRKEVREKYREVAEDPSAEYHFHTGRSHAIRLGYPSTPLDQLPDEACEAFAGVGNPFYWGGPKPGERVVDLGSGAGMDSFLAALWVGRAGRVIGVDMTPEMLVRGKAIAANLGLGNVEFREGLIEDLPVEDGWADVVISNGVINLCPDKIGVYRQIFRVLKPGGRMTVADICLERPVPEEALRDIDLWTG